MRLLPPPLLEAGRIHSGHYGSDASLGMTGAYRLRRHGITLLVLASDGAGWEHVSVSTPIRTPTYEELTFVKELFWDDDEVVMHLWVPKAEHINNHPHCLHLWKPVGQPIPLPPPLLVGVPENKEAGHAAG